MQIIESVNIKLFQGGYISNMNNDGRCVIVDHTDIVSATVINHLQVFESYTGKGLVYVCKNHTIRRADCKHIQLVKCIVITNRGYTNNNFRIME